MEFSLINLNTDGHFVSKIFMGGDFKEIYEMAKKSFKDVRIYKPLSSRKESKENFIICKYLC